MPNEKIVSLFGHAIPTPKGHAELVEYIQWLLDLATAGEIVGITGAILYRDDAVATIGCGISTVALLGRLEQRKQKMIEELNEA
jgi:hypothetical protein